MSEPIEVRLAQVAELHQPQPIYGDCWHAPDYGCTPVEVPWVDGCNQSIEGWYCPTCCTANDVYLRADCPHGWDHTACTALSACATMDAITGAKPPVECSHDVVEFYPGNKVPPYGWEQWPDWYCTHCGQQIDEDERR